MRSILGLAVLLGLAWIMSENRWRVPWRVVIAGVAIQLALTFTFNRFPASAEIFLLLDRGVEALQSATDAGTSFVFGYLGGGPPPFAMAHPEDGFILAFKVLPLVLVISALSSLLFHWGILQATVAAFAWVLRRTMGIGGALGLGAAVHIFVGMVEAPLLIRPYLDRMSRGELFALMTVGMAGVAGTVMVVYAAILGPVIPGALANILMASVISTPAGLAVAALMIPPERAPADETARLVIADPPVGAMDAIVKGTTEGVGLLVSIAALLLVVISLVTLVNMALGMAPSLGGEAVTLQRLFALPFRPVMWLIGIPWAQSGTAADLMATKTVLNEFAAYLQLAHLPPDALSPRAKLIVTYALCGFANFGSFGILIGGIGAMLPGRKHEVVGLGLRSILAGTIATCMSGAAIGALAA